MDGITCRALLARGAGSASAALIKHLGKQLSRTEHKRIEMMMCSTTQKIEQYDMKISNTCTRGKFEMKTTVSKVDKGVLLSIPNPQYNDKIKMFPHPGGVMMDDEDTKPELPMHLILGASEYSRIKTQTKPKSGKAGEPEDRRRLCSEGN